MKLFDEAGLARLRASRESLCDAVDLMVQIVDPDSEDLRAIESLRETIGRMDRILGAESDAERMAVVENLLATARKG